MRALLGALAGVVALSVAAEAGAFQIHSSVTHGCHERITLAGLDQASWPGGATPPAATQAERRWIDDLAYSLPARSRDPWTAALVVGARYPDVHGHQPTRLSDIVHIHNDPEDQPAHCIRGEAHDGPAGDREALAACRAYILGEVAAALGDGDEVDVGAVVPVEIFLTFRGQVTVDLSRYAFHAGRALHALQDSYTHAFRAPADGRVRHVLNWIDFARSPSYDEERDGFRHVAGLDDCTRGGEGSRLRVERAAAATRDLLAALADGRGGRAGRLSRVEAVLDAAFAIEPGCTADNAYCDAPELREAGGCSAAGGSGRGGLAGCALLLGLLARRRRASLVAALAVAFAATLAGAGAARAEVGRIGASVSLAGSVDRGGAAASVGLRYRLTNRLLFGADAEYNPWFSLDAGEMAPGAMNFYGSVIYRYVQTSSFELRSSVQVGTSTILFDLVGVDKGTTGLYLGSSLLAVGVQLSSRSKLIIDPASIAMPTPQVRGMPFAYRQYRTTVSLEWTP
jgi:hypothetical protein